MRRLVKPTIFITGLNLGGLVISFVTQLIVAALFGARYEMDAYLAASLLPSVATAVVSGSLGFVLIPFFMHQRSSEGEKASWVAMSSVLNLATVVLGAVTVLGIVFRRPLLGVVVPGLDPSTLQLAADLSVILWPTLVVASVSAILIGLNQAEERFVWQALVPLAGSALQLIVMMSFARRFGIASLAMAVLIGAVAQLVLLLPTVLKHGRYTLRAPLMGPAVKTLAVGVLPLMGSRVFSDASSVVDRYLASLLIVGSIARLNYGSRISALSLTLFSAALPVTIFPLMSAAAAGGDLKTLRRTFAIGTRYTWLFYVPVVFLVCGLSQPFIGALLQRGQFTKSDTAIVAGLLPWYMLSMSARALGNMSSRTIYALGGTGFMSILNVLVIVVYCAGAFWFVQRLGAVGIPIAAALTDWLFYFVHGVFIWRATGRITEEGFVAAIARITLAGATSGLAAWSVSSVVDSTDAVRLVLGGAVGVVTYGGALVALRAPEIKVMGIRLFDRVFSN